jgi:hypothetical protein
VYILYISFDDGVDLLLCYFMITYIRLYTSLKRILVFWVSMRGRAVPDVLKERLLIDESDRSFLQSIDELSPNNNSVIYVTPSIFNRQVPTLKQISDKTGKSKKEVWKQLNKIGKVWNVPSPDNLPTNSGFFDKEDALVNAVTNQHRLRWDDNRGDYRVTKFHEMNAEMGFGQLYTNNEAFQGQNIFRKAMGLDAKLNSVHFQGGIMPEMIQIFGKAKNQRALMTGINKTGAAGNGDELKKVKQTLTLGDHEVTKKDMKNLTDYVVDTLGSLEEAGKSVAHEMLPLVENVPEHVPIHMYWSYNDVANMSEIEDTLNASLRKIHSKMKSVTKSLPKWREEWEGVRNDLGKSLIDKLVLERVYFHVNKEKSKSGDEFAHGGAGFGKLVDGYFHTVEGKDKAQFKKLKDRVRGEYEDITGKRIDGGVAEEQFSSEFFGIVNRIYDEHVTFGHLQRAHEGEQDNFGKVHNKISSLEDKICEAERFENALMAEGEGPAWFTGHIAITPMEAKALQMVKKKKYKDVYTEILIPELKRLSGKDLNIKLHTDSIINVNVPDPQDLIEGVELTADSPIGTTFTSFPRTNEQRSNEPLLNSAAELQGFHMGEVSERIKKGGSKPKTIGEFSKRNFSASDVYFSGYGSDGFMHQARFTIGPTTIKDEFRLQPEIAQYMKLTTRHNTSKLGELMLKGNRGTWHAKRMAKGGCTTGNVIYVEHADQSFQPIFVDDVVYEKIADEYGEEYSGLEKTLKETRGKLRGTKNVKAKEKCRDLINETKKRIGEIHEAVSPQLYNVLLQNDLHLGGYSTPGRPSLVDGIEASQLVAAQAFGLDGIQYGIMTEAMNGEMGYRDFDSKREGGHGSKRSSVEFMRDLGLIEAKMRESGMTDSQVIEHIKTYTKEFEESKPQFLPETQVALFQQAVQPINEELMDNGMRLYVGTGNHWMGGKRGSGMSEGDVICNLFDGNYLDQGMLIKGKEASGQSYSYETVNIPSVDGNGIPAVITHKLKSGKTEISHIPKHLVGTRTPAMYCFTSDRHHAGVGAEKGKMFVLDTGKQPTVPYVDMIGKVSSLRGAMVAQYGAGGEQIIGARHFMDSVTDKISGWDYTAGVLKECKSFLEEAVMDNSLVTQKRKIDYMHEKNKGRFDLVDAKYGK